MKILVPIKRVIDAYVKIRIKPDNTGVETTNAKMALNPFDEIAVEEAVRLKEQGIATEIVVVTIGPEHSQEALRTALALGADRAIHIPYEKDLEALNVAKILKVIVEKESPKFVIMGKQAIDSDNNQTGQMLAALLNWPQATFASAVKLLDGQVEVTREIDGGLETLALQLPAIITTDLRLNVPRYASLPNIMQAKKKPLETIELDSLGVTLKDHLTVTNVAAPAERSAGIKVHTVHELIDKLKNEAKVL